MSFTNIYTKDQLDVQKDLILAVEMQFLPALKAIFKSDEWLKQERPVPQGILRSLCPLVPGIDQCICAFCPGVTFPQSGRALEHIQQHFGLRPFQCTAPDCRKTFLRKNELKNHSNTHAVPGHVPCQNNCGTYFSSDKNIARHLNETCTLQGSN